MKPPKGHTLVELLFCLLIAGILLSLATPSFVVTVENSRQTEAVNQLLGALHYARGVAVMERRVVSVCAGEIECADKPVWKGHILVFNDRNRNGRLDGDERLLFSNRLPDGHHWYWRSFRTQNHLSFSPNAATTALNGTFTLCKEDLALQQVVISLSGRVRTQSPSRTARCR